MDALAAAKRERDEAISDAVERGGSVRQVAAIFVRQVAAISGLSDRTVQTIGHDNGWPTAAQRKK
jgi:hypothetical protein